MQVGIALRMGNCIVVFLGFRLPIPNKLELEALEGWLETLAADVGVNEGI